MARWLITLSSVRQEMAEMMKNWSLMGENRSVPFSCVVVDVETTGLSPRWGDRVIEIGAVVLENNAVVAEFSTLVQAPREIPYQVSQINGITNEMLVGQPLPEEVFPAFHDFIAESVLIAHNARFDMSFLRQEFDRLGLAFANRTACTLEMSRQHFPRLPNHKLETVARHVLGGLPSAAQLHRALVDARLTAQLWLALTAGR